MATPWEVLGVPERATAEQIHAARRRLSLRFHPDLVGPVGHTIMADINAAAEAALRACPSTALVRRRRPTRWDEVLAPEPRRGRHADLAA